MKERLKWYEYVIVVVLAFVVAVLIVGCKNKLDVPTLPKDTPSVQPSSLRVMCTADVTEGETPLVVRFLSGVSGGTQPFSYLWSFGDGQTSVEKNVTHMYGLETESGRYIVTCTVTDSAGGQASAEMTIVVHGLNPMTMYVRTDAAAAPIYAPSANFRLYVDEVGVVDFAFVDAVYSPVTQSWYLEALIDISVREGNHTIRWELRSGRIELHVLPTFSWRLQVTFDYSNEHLAVVPSNQDTGWAHFSGYEESKEIPFSVALKGS